MRAWLLVAIAGCYQPSPQSGAPCVPSQPVCPEGQTCMAVGGGYECLAEPLAVDAKKAVDARPDATVPADGSATPHWTLVQTAASVAATTPIEATGSGDLIVVALQTTDTSAITAVTDNAAGGADTYTRIATSRATDTGDQLGVEIWYASASHSGATTITVTTNPVIATVVWEVSGIRTTSPLDVATAASNQAASTTPSGASITTTAAGDFVVSAVILTNATTGIHTGNAFTNDQETQGNGWAHLTDAMAPAGTYQAQWDQPMSGGTCASSAAFFLGP